MTSPTNRKVPSNSHNALLMFTFIFVCCVLSACLYRSSISDRLSTMSPSMKCPPFPDDSLIKP